MRPGKYGHVQKYPVLKCRCYLSRHLRTEILKRCISSSQKKPEKKSAGGKPVACRNKNELKYRDSVRRNESQTNGKSKQFVSDWIQQLTACGGPPVFSGKPTVKKFGRKGQPKQRNSQLGLNEWKRNGQQNPQR